MKNTPLGTNEDIKPVGIWIRVSTEDQARGESPEHHEHRARMYAEAKGWRVREVYHLEAVSGKSVMGLPETERMLGHIRSGQITGLIFSKLARLARNTRELLDFADIFRENDADLVSLGESIDTSTPAGRLFYTMIAAMAQWEREEISERIAASVPIRAKLGKPTAGVAPFGYHWVGKKLVPHPEEAPVRKLIYEMFLEHRRVLTVARLLNHAGYRTRGGKRWTDTTVVRLIRDPTAWGLRRANYTTHRGPGKGMKLKPREEWVHVPVEPIVSEQVWRAANSVLEERKRTGTAPSRRTAHLFAGFAFCSCGQAKMYVPSKMKKYVCPRCRNKIGIEDLEAVFHAQLKSFLCSPAEIRGYLEQADQTIRDKEALLQSLEVERERVRLEMDRVYRAYMDDKISVDAYGSQYMSLWNRNKQIEEEIPRLQGETDFLRIQLQSSDEILSEARDVHASWPTFAPDEKRQIIEAIVEKVIVGKDDVTINLCHLPPSPETVAGGQRLLNDRSR